MNTQAPSETFTLQAAVPVPHSDIEQRYQELYLIEAEGLHRKCKKIEATIPIYNPNFHDDLLMTVQPVVVACEEILGDIRDGLYGDVGYNKVENLLPLLQRVSTAVGLITQKFREMRKPDNLLDRLTNLQERIDTVVAQFHPDGLVMSVEEYEAKVAASANVEAQFEAGATNTPLVLTPAQRVEGDPNAPRVAAE